MQMTVTDRAISKVLIEVAMYAGTVNTILKFSRLKPGETKDVNGSTFQKAVISKRKSETI